MCRKELQELCAGRKYELPSYVVSEPSNLTQDKPVRGQNVELMARDTQH